MLREARKLQRNSLDSLVVLLIIKQGGSGLFVFSVLGALSLVLYNHFITLDLPEIESFSRHDQTVSLLVIVDLNGLFSLGSHIFLEDDKSRALYRLELQHVGQ